MNDIEALNRTLVEPTGAIYVPSFFPRPNAALVSALIGIAVGTGGVASADVLHYYLPRATPQYVVESAASGLAVLDSTSLVEQLILIRSQLDATLTDLARVLNVERPTIYAWMSGRSSPRTANVQRITLIYRLGQRLRARIGPAASLAGYRLAGGSTLIDLLSAPTLDETSVQRHLDAINVAQAAERLPSVSQIRQRWGFRRREAAKQDMALRDASIQ